MAGFFNRTNGGSITQISETIKKLSNLGLRFNDSVVKNSLAIGPTLADKYQESKNDPDLLVALQMADTLTNNSKYICIFDKEYKNKRDFLRKFALNGEVEYCLELLADECIVYDDSNLFCRPIIQNSQFLQDSKMTQINTSLTVNFKRIYSYFNFNTSGLAWSLFKQWLVDGVLAFEIIYNDEKNSIIGFQELDPISLQPGIENGPDGAKKIWIQYPDEKEKTRTLYDSQVIYLSYSKGNYVNRVSYVERLVRSHNLLRLMEHTRVIWNIMNSTYRMKMVVPVGSSGKQRSMESLNELLAKYKEDIYLDFDSGELMINGKASMQFYKNYMFPKKDGDSPEIEAIGSEGPTLTDTDIIDFFQKKFRVDSKIPLSRFSRDGSSTFYLSADGIDREEISFNKFCIRLRSIFQEIIMKPLTIQMLLDHEELKDNELFLTSLGLIFNSDALFEEMRTAELLSKRVELCSTLQGFQNNDGSSSMFDAEFLIKKYLKLPAEDWAMNMKMLKKENTDEETADAAAGAMSDYGS